MEQLKPIDILLVEDNAGDARLVKEALFEGKLKNILHVVNDGMEATDFLFRKNKSCVFERRWWNKFYSIYIKK